MTGRKITTGYRICQKGFWACSKSGGRGAAEDGVLPCPLKPCPMRELMPTSLPSIRVEPHGDGMRHFSQEACDGDPDSLVCSSHLVDTAEASGGC